MACSFPSFLVLFAMVACFCSLGVYSFSVFKVYGKTINSAILLFVDRMGNLLYCSQASSKSVVL